MGIQQMNHEMRRQIRSHIIHACDKLDIVLSENTIENMIAARISELTAEVVSGHSPGYINWEDKVKVAHKAEIEGMNKFREKAIKMAGKLISEE